MSLHKIKFKWIDSVKIKLDVFKWIDSVKIKLEMIWFKFGYFYYKIKLKVKLI